MLKERDYQEMIFTIEHYSWKVSREEARVLMWQDICTFLTILLKNGQIATIHEEETDIIIIRYAHNEAYDVWGIQNPFWITEEQYWNICKDEEEENEGI